jgi:hypothetical protein
MHRQQAEGWTRRRLLGGLTLAGTVGFLGLYPRPVAAEPPLETTRLRVHHSLSLCLAPQYVAEELLWGEGFTEVHYVTHEEAGGLYPALASGAADLANDFAPVLLMRVDAGDPITILGGLHVGCFELFGTERVRAIRDLKGKRVAVRGLGLPPMSSSPVWRPMWVWILPKTSSGSCTPPPRRCSSSPRGRSMPSWAFRRSPKHSGPGRSGTWW